MSILASVSDVLTLLAAGVALLAAARALQAARRATQPAPTAIPQPPSPTARAAKPEPIPATPAAAPDRSATTAAKRDGNDNGAQGRGEALREQIRAHLAGHDGRDLSLVEVSNGVDRRSATVSYALDKLIAAGHVELTNPKPRRYAITQAGRQATPDNPTPAQDTAQPAEDAGQPAKPATSTPAAERPTSPRVKATASSTPAGPRARGGGLREEVRAFLASQPGQPLSVGEISGGLGRSTATLSYHIQGLVDAGEATLVDGKPRRYTIAAAPSPASEPATSSASPARRSSRRATPAGERKSGSGRAKSKAGAATGKVAAPAK